MTRQNNTSESPDPIKSQASCPVCHSVNWSEWKAPSGGSLDSPDRVAISSKDFGSSLRLVKCLQCQLVFAPNCNQPDLNSLYAKLEDKGYLDSFKARQQQMLELVSMALRMSPNAKTCLDLGTGAGMLLDVAGKMGLQALGIEPCKSLVEFGRKTFGVEIIEGTFPMELKENRQFDLIFLIDVVEHVVNPVELLKTAGNHLASKGKMIIVTPDIRSITAKIMGSQWWHYRLAHVVYFDRKSILTALDKAGLKRDAWFIPMWYLPLGYILSRIETLLERIPVLGRLVRQISVMPNSKNVIRFTLFDSIGIVACKNS